MLYSRTLAYLPDSEGETWPRLIAFWWTNVQTVSFSLALNMISANIAGYTKKQFTNALTFIAYCVGNIVGPQFVLQRQAPNFPTATKAMMIGFAGKVVCHAILGIYLLASNRRRDKEQGTQRSSRDGVNGSEGEKELRERAEDQGMLDKTEFENRALRYVL